MESSTLTPVVMDETEWTRRRGAHRTRIDGTIGAYLDDRGHGAVHPVVDFLFTYYSFRPGQLKRWNPGYGVVLTGTAAEEYAEFASYEAVTIDGERGFRVRESLLERRRSAIEFTSTLLQATQSRPSNLGCFGLHEWAMVYRGGADALRHGDVALRLGHDGTDQVVESMKLRCSHYDAFRFFTADAIPLNTVGLTPEGRTGSEQPGCVHAAMDLYKWAYKLSPLIDSDFVAECFDLAMAAREVDMRASPYDLSEYAMEPIRIESPTGRAEYVREQHRLSARATPLRSELIRRCQNLLVRGGYDAGPTAE